MTLSWPAVRMHIFEHPNCTMQGQPFRKLHNSTPSRNPSADKRATSLESPSNEVIRAVAPFLSDWRGISLVGWSINGSMIVSATTRLIENEYQYDIDLDRRGNTTSGI